MGFNLGLRFATLLLSRVTITRINSCYKACYKRCSVCCELHAQPRPAQAHRLDLHYIWSLVTSLQLLGWVEQVALGHFELLFRQCTHGAQLCKLLQLTDDRLRFLALASIRERRCE